MTDKNENINEILRTKFLDYEVTPPPEVWKNIEKDLNKSAFFSFRNISIAVIILLLIGLPITYFSFYDSNETETLNETQTTLTETIVDENYEVEDSQELNTEQSSENVTESIIVEESVVNKYDNKTLIVEEETELIVSNEPISAKQKKPDQSIIDNAVIEKPELSIITLKEGFVIDEDNTNQISSLSSLSLNGEKVDLSDLPLNKQDEILNALTENQKKKTFWEYNVLFSPEFSFAKMDSVTILPSYSFGVEPMKYLNDHWFLRSGINISYTADKGFAKVDYMSNDMMGTYDDVIDVTFDTIDGEMVTIYNTKTVEVWDSVNHIVVTEITNRYMYAQIPALLGYKNKAGNLNWYIYGGPAIGFQISEWIENPMSNNEEVTIIDLDNKLPLRSKFNYQLWLGAGLEYYLNKRYSFVIEPTYKHYFKSLYDNPDYKINTSGFAVRFGLHIKIVN